MVESQKLKIQHLNLFAVLDFQFLHVRSSLKKHILRKMIFVVRKKAVI